MNTNQSPQPDSIQLSQSQDIPQQQTPSNTTHPPSTPSAQQSAPSTSKPKCKGGRPKLNQQKPLYDGSTPLENIRLEQMCNLKVAGITQDQAFINTGKGHIKRKYAKEQASRMFNRPDVKTRFLWLQAHPEQKNPAQNAPGGPISTAGKATPAGKMPRKADLALAQRKASEALYLAETPADIVKAVSACRDLGLIDTAEQAKADPTLVLQAILSYAGRTGAEIAEQLGGLAFMLDKFISVCKCSPAELMQTLAQRYPDAMAPAK